MNPVIIFRIVSYVLGTTFFLVGLIFLIGWFVPSYIPENFRIMLGALMILWGIYRIAMTRFRATQLERHEELD